MLARGLGLDSLLALFQPYSSFLYKSHSELTSCKLNVILELQFAASFKEDRNASFVQVWVPKSRTHLLKTSQVSGIKK